MLDHRPPIGLHQFKNTIQRRVRLSCDQAGSHPERIGGRRLGHQASDDIRIELVAPMPFELLMLAKTSGAILLGTANALVPLTYGADVLHGAVRGLHTLSFTLDLAILGVFCFLLFMRSLHNIRKRWIV